MAVIYTSYGFILGRNKNLYIYVFFKAKLLIESLIDFFLQAASIILKKDRHRFYYLLVDIQCTYDALAREIQEEKIPRLIPESCKIIRWIKQ